jgi:hypothetical protein
MVRPALLRTLCRSERVYSHVMRLLNEYDVMLDGILLKPNMCLPGGWRVGVVGGGKPTCACQVCVCGGGGAYALRAAGWVL